MKFRPRFTDTAGSCRGTLQGIGSVVVARERALVGAGANTHGSLIGRGSDRGLLWLGQVGLVLFDLCTLVLCVLVDDGLVRGQSRAT